ncbi:MAG TPA: Bax inhibitor-1/YccA family protein [Nocardioidaceae bacterium]|nr:Bax inhibitor-1/YccA family protein [Nocardioidaceae bacterium]
MQSSNPVFARSEGFNGRGSTNAYGNQTYAGNGTTYPGYGTPQSDPSTWGTGSPGAPTSVDQGRMTIDSVVQKTGITIGLVVLTAALTWVLMPERLLSMAWMGGAFAGLGLALVLSFKKVISPGLVLAYAVAEGLFVGAMSKTFESLYDGVVVGAVMGTVAAVAGTLAAYKFFNIQVTPKFRKFVVAAMFGFVAIVLLDFVLSFFGAEIGFNNFGTLGLIMSVVGLGIGVLMLILDFDFVERGVAAGLPEVESWRAAFGLTVTIIWIYIEILRILAILRGSD